MKITIKHFIKDIVSSILQDRNGSLKSWFRWIVILCVLFGLPFQAKYNRFVKQVTGRDPKKLPKKGFKTALFLTGRRSGKSIMSAIIGAFIALFSGKEKLCTPGEIPLVPIISPTIKQSRIVKSYLRAIFDLPILRSQIVRETQWGFELKNGVVVEILTGDWRAVRGYTLIACIIDEICFFGLDAESKVRSDSELIRAIRPALASLDGYLICISSPYAMKGWAYTTFKKHFGNDDSSILVVNCGSKTLNPTLSQRIVDEALAEDPQSAKSEYLGEFRDDVCTFITPEILEPLIVKGRQELMPFAKINYRAFVDVSGGRSDSGALCIAHKNDSGKIVLDFLKEYKAPFNPQSVIADMCVNVRRFKLGGVTGDFYGAEFNVQEFQRNGISYSKSAKNKSQLYMELLPRINSGQLELLDIERMIKQLCNLERRTRSGGIDIIDHGPNGKDDLANTVAGVVDCLSNYKKLGVW